MSLKVLSAVIDWAFIGTVTATVFHFTGSVLDALLAVIFVALYGLWCFIDGCLQ